MVALLVEHWVDLKVDLKVAPSVVQKVASLVDHWAAPLVAH
jgi:hypothetical protein